MTRPNRPLRIARPSGMRERLVAVFMLGLALFNPPLLAVFGKGGTVGGVPVLFVYLFVAWIGLIVLLAAIIEGHGEEGTEKSDDLVPRDGGDG